MEQRDWNKPDRDEWVAALVDAVAAAQRPVVILAHGLGATTTVLAAEHMAGRVAGAMLAAPPAAGLLAHYSDLRSGFAGIPMAPLPFPSLVFASRNDPDCPHDDAGAMALSWGSALVDAGEAGKLDAASGHGPWPEGLMRFGGFLGRL